MDQFTPAGSVRRLSNAYSLALTAVMTAVIAVLAPFSIPIGPIHLSLTVLTVYLSVYLLGWKLGTVSVVVYIALGMVGAPVFTGFAGGMGKVLGPSGGYIIGYIPMALVAGVFIERFSLRRLQLVGMLLGIAALYTFGTVWYCLQGNVPVGEALWACVIPFIPVDTLKSLCVLTIGPTIRQRLVQSGVLKG